MALLRKLFWIALFAASTFAFTVLFQYGPSNFATNAEKEWTALRELVSKATGQKPADQEKGKLK